MFIYCTSFVLWFVLIICCFTLLCLKKEKYAIDYLFDLAAGLMMEQKITNSFVDPHEVYLKSLFNCLESSIGREYLYVINYVFFYDILRVHYEIHIKIIYFFTYCIYL